MSNANVIGFVLSVWTELGSLRLTKENSYGQRPFRQQLLTFDLAKLLFSSRVSVVRSVRSVFQEQFTPSVGCSIYMDRIPVWLPVVTTAGNKRWQVTKTKAMTTTTMMATRGIRQWRGRAKANSGREKKAAVFSIIFDRGLFALSGVRTLAGFLENNAQGVMIFSGIFGFFTGWR